MDLLNTFFIANAALTVTVLIGFLSLRESAAAAVTGAGKRLASFNYAGVGGAASSMVLLASVAALFR